MGRSVSRHGDVVTRALHGCRAEFPPSEVDASQTLQQRHHPAAMRRLPVFVASLVVAFLAGSAPAAAALPPAKPAAGPAAATTLQLGSLSKAQLKAKIAKAKIARPTRLFEELEGDGLPEMQGDKTTNGFKLEYRGIKATAYDDADKADEVAVWIAVVRATPSGYTKSVHRVGTPMVLSDKHPGAVDGAATLFDGDRTPVLLVSAAIEDDDGSSAQWMAELDVLLEQAIAAATVMREPDDDPIDVVHGTIELGRIMLGADPGRPDVGFRKIRTTDWDMLWDLDPTIDGPPLDPRTAAHKTTKAPAQPRFVYKLMINAKVGAGRYVMRFDVPAKAGRKPRRVVKVDLDKMKLVTPGDEIDATVNHEFVVRVCIAQTGWVGMDWDAWSIPGSCIEKVMSAPYSDYWPEFKVYRRMQQGSTKVNVFAWWRSTSNKSSGFKFLDFDDGDLGFAKLETMVGGSAGALEYHLQGDGDGGGLYNSQCYSCGFPSGSAIGKLDMHVRY